MEQKTTTEHPFNDETITVVEPVPKMMNSVLLLSKKQIGFGQMPVPSPGYHQVLIKVASAALNPTDILFIADKYKIGLKYPFTPGWEGSGTVVAAGSGVYSKWLLNKRVAFMRAFQDPQSYTLGGSFAEYCVTDVKNLIPLAPSHTFDEGSTFTVNPLTAVCLVERCKKLRARCIIVTAACSQIGRMIVRLCEQARIVPICIVRREEQVEILKEMNQKYVVSTSTNGYRKQLFKICSQLKPTVCLECVSGSTTGEILEFLGFGSTLILYGLLSSKKVTDIEPVAFIGKG